MDDSTSWRTKIRGHVAAVLLNAAVYLDRLKVTYLLVSCDKVFLDVTGDLTVRQGTCPEILGVVSRELGDLKVAGHLNQIDQLVFVVSDHRRLVRCLRPFNRSSQQSLGGQFQLADSGLAVLRQIQVV